MNIFYVGLGDDFYPDETFIFATDKTDEAEIQKEIQEIKDTSRKVNTKLLNAVADNLSKIDFEVTWGISGSEIEGAVVDVITGNEVYDDEQTDPNIKCTKCQDLIVFESDYEENKDGEQLHLGFCEKCDVDVQVVKDSDGNCVRINYL